MSLARRFHALLCGLASTARGVAAAGTLDDGKLDPAYFGGQAEFREADDVDYLWVSRADDAAGLRLEGRIVDCSAGSNVALPEGRKDPQVRRAARGGR